MYFNLQSNVRLIHLAISFGSEWNSSSSYTLPSSSSSGSSSIGRCVGNDSGGCGGGDGGILPSVDSGSCVGLALFKYTGR